MALANVLSALRVLILDGLDIPEELQAREGLYREKFPALTSLELEDLVKIPPSKFDIYTGTIFAGNRSVLSSHFPVSFALIEKDWAKTNKEKFNRYTFVQNLHEKRPWKSNETTSLAKSFIDYLSLDRKDLSQEIPGLLEMAEFERLSLVIKRERDLYVDSKDLVLTKDLSTLTVDQLLELEFNIPYCLRIAEFTYDVRSFRESFFKNDRTIKSKLEKKDILVAGARNRYNSLAWKEIEKPSKIFFEKAESGSKHKLSRLAEIYVEKISDQSEEEVFYQFLADTTKLIEIGGILLRRW